MERFAITRKQYRGSKPAKKAEVVRLNKIATLLENHINAELAKSPGEIIVLNYRFMARDIGVDHKDVHDLLFGRGGSNGITLRSPEIH